MMQQIDGGQKISLLDYWPIEKRSPDYQYQELLETVYEFGSPASSFHAEKSKSYIAPNPLRYNLKNGIPLGTERSMRDIGASAVAEILAFINGATTQAELIAFGVNPIFWRDFVTEEKCAEFGLQAGDLGPGSYGGAFGHYPTSDGKEINQFKNVIEQMKRAPKLRTHFVSPWIPQYCVAGENAERKVVVAPCHGWIHMRILEEGLYLHMFQRSGDVPIGVPCNIYQYSVLTLLIAHVLGIKAAYYCHSFSDAHIYNNQAYQTVQLLEVEPKIFPSVYLRADTPKDLFQIRLEHIILEDYNPNPPIKGIPVAI